MYQTMIYLYCKERKHSKELHRYRRMTKQNFNEMIENTKKRIDCLMEKEVDINITSRLYIILNKRNVIIMIDLNIIIDGLNLSCGGLK